MANNDKRRYPALSAKYWWELRQLFKRSIPSVLSPNTIASQFDMKEKSANDNVLLPLRSLGLVDSEYKVDKDLAARLRDDQEYPAACGELRERIYPEELRDAYPPGHVDPEAVARWLANETKTGEAYAKRMAQFYQVLTDADPKAEPAAGVSTRDTSSKKQTVSKPNATAKPKARPRKDDRSTLVPDAPTFNLNIQIHIAADTPIEKVEKVFAAMRREFYHEDS